MPDIGSDLISLVRSLYTLLAKSSISTSIHPARGRIPLPSKKEKCCERAWGTQNEGRFGLYLLLRHVNDPTQNITFLSHLTKFRVVPSHVILHIFKVCLDDFTGTNIDNIAMLLEGCGRFLLRSEETAERFSTMVSAFLSAAKTSLMCTNFP